MNGMPGPEPAGLTGAGWAASLVMPGRNARSCSSPDKRARGGFSAFRACDVKSSTGSRSQLLRWPGRFCSGGHTKELVVETGSCAIISFYTNGLTLELTSYVGEALAPKQSIILSAFVQ